MKMKDKKAKIPLIFLFMLLLLLSLLLLSSFSSLPPSTFSFPSSSRRSLKKNKSISDVDEKMWMQHHDFQKKERMDIEIADYTGTGANNHHDPGSPPGTTT
ncbi:hypothetical protein ABFS82_09G002300 [Erythranthe guttata]|uniref:Uncharacterized protein n=1 Tax=Erythranthe guttata TaxID=4155 RepID=A0A022Q2S3_ERYGU|nr:PREDICTED: uncharacterized protein LOC105975053 [Erythranthe guttata]EYU22301.1 hypothetical protein MIMGU_mgv1a016930mg [Erythranthe guttata]|eukprot:XP_012855676.1 PREDICTED: uncharacterized protein LOC105975053 [Erythranthe guttata]